MRILDGTKDAPIDLGFVGVSGKKITLPHCLSMFVRPMRVQDGL